ncbi:hypothetical protein XM53_00955 [Roseovarius atlanticus]|uniref:Uncharacterized protein n=1 Tax=Roseovarius atlanticus TaxID=1641875 RepID=A0A0T5NZQ1_9RHOB|nr:hypothetical protein [Roseovarius atlanticus]KRS14333.1 hypothetical protein XM53_00955 [Roseovarius atlanticus]
MRTITEQQLENEIINDAKIRHNETFVQEWAGNVQVTVQGYVEFAGADLVLNRVFVFEYEIDDDGEIKHTGWDESETSFDEFNSDDAEDLDIEVEGFDEYDLMSRILEIVRTKELITTRESDVREATRFAEQLEMENRMRADIAEELVEEDY